MTNRCTCFTAKKTRLLLALCLKPPAEPLHDPSVAGKKRTRLSLRSFFPTESVWHPDKRASRHHDMSCPVHALNFKAKGTHVETRTTKYGGSTINGYHSFDAIRLLRENGAARCHTKGEAVVAAGASAGEILNGNQVHITLEGGGRGRGGGVDGITGTYCMSNLTKRNLTWKWPRRCVKHQ